MAGLNRINWLITVALIGCFFYLLAPVLTPFVAAAILAYIGNPLTGRLQRLRFSRTVAVAIVFLLTFLFLGLLVFLVAPLMQKQVSALFQALPGTITQIEQVWLPRVIELLDIDIFFLCFYFFYRFYSAKIQTYHSSFTDNFYRCFN